MTEHRPLLVDVPQLQDARGSRSPATSAVTVAAASNASIARRRFVGRATLAFVLALLATAAVMALSWSAPHRASSLELETIMERYRAMAFAGVVRLSHNGERKFSDWMGLASEEFDAPMQKHSVFPIGSHSKLFTAIAMLQLQERGRVNLSHSLSAYLDASDFARFGFANQTHWCPRVEPSLSASAAAGATPCENVTFEQLLYMGSGLHDTHLTATETGASASLAPDQLLYRGSIAKHVALFINAPLAFRPGTGFAYAHANYVLLSYMIEKLSGQALDAYLHEHVFAPLGLKKTSYDPDSGARGVHRGVVNQYANLFVEAPAQHRTLVSTGACSAYPESGALSGAGGLYSSAKDMHRVYKDLFLHRGQQSAVLTEASIRALLLTRNPVHLTYAFGVSVAFDAADDGAAWPAKIANCGRMQCVATCMAMQTLGADSVISAAFTNHVAYTFASHDALATWDPRSVRDSTAWRDDGAANVSNSNSSSSAGVSISDYQVAELSWALLDVFLRYFVETERS